MPSVQFGIGLADLSTITAETLASLRRPTAIGPMSG